MSLRSPPNPAFLWCLLLCPDWCTHQAAAVRVFVDGPGVVDGGEKGKCGHLVPNCGVLVLQSGYGDGVYRLDEPAVHGLWPYECLLPKNRKAQPQRNDSCFIKPDLEEHEWMLHGLCAGTRDRSDYVEQTCSLSALPLANMKATRQELDNTTLSKSQRTSLLRQMAERLHLSEDDIDEGTDGCRMQLKVPVCFDGRSWKLSNDFEHDCGVAQSEAVVWANKKNAGKEEMAKLNDLKKLNCGTFVPLCAFLVISPAELDLSGRQGAVRGLWLQGGQHGSSKCILPTGNMNYTPGTASNYSCYEKNFLDGGQAYTWNRHGMCAGIRDADDFFSVGCELAARPLATMRNQEVATQEYLEAPYEVDVFRSRLAGDSRLWLPACSRGDGRWQLSAVKDFETNCGNEELFRKTKLCKSKEACLLKGGTDKIIQKKRQEVVSELCTPIFIMEQVTGNDMACGTTKMEKSLQRLNGMVKGLQTKGKTQTTIYKRICSDNDLLEAQRLLTTHCTTRLRGDASKLQVLPLAQLVLHLLLLCHALD